MCLLFLFSKISLLLLSVELQLDGDWLGQQEDALPLIFVWYQGGFSKELRNFFYLESSGAKHSDCVIFGDSDLALFRWLSTFRPFLWAGDFCGCSLGSSSWINVSVPQPHTDFLPTARAGEIWGGCILRVNIAHVQRKWAVFTQSLSTPALCLTVGSSSWGR